jgi:hypothetical protein
MLGGMEQSGGEVINAGSLQITGGFTLSGGTVLTQDDTANPASLTADTLVQTGATLTVTGYLTSLTVTDTYEFAGGTADVNLLSDQDQFGASFDTLLVEAPDLSLSGHIAATNEFYVAPGGEVFVYNGAENTQVTANIVVDGTLRLGIAHLIGNVTNNGRLVLGVDDYDPGSGVQLTGNFTQSGSGTFEVHTASGTVGNLLAVSGFAQLGGTLFVNQEPGTTAWFATLMTYGSRQGAFTLSGPPELLMWYDDPIANALGVRVQPDN